MLILPARPKPHGQGVNGTGAVPHSPDQRYDGLRLTMHEVVSAAMAALPWVAEVFGDPTAVDLESGNSTLGVPLYPRAPRWPIRRQVTGGSRESHPNSL